MRKQGKKHVVDEIEELTPPAPPRFARHGDEKRTGTKTLGCMGGLVAVSLVLTLFFLWLRLTG
jgi:hypothetical protein